MSKKVSILDYGGGNLGSVVKAVSELGFTPEIVCSPRDVETASCLILPGQGAIKQAMTQLSGTQLDKAILEYIGRDKPFFGICLGMQLLFESSEEDGGQAGLGVFKGTVKKFKTSSLRVPHMGWNTVDVVSDHNGYFNQISHPNYAYFAHSFYVETPQTDIICTQTHYGQPFTSSIQKDNVLGIQFHPEKSGAFGMSLLYNFLQKWSVL
jgi:glutamine amidotransferase